MKTLKINFVIFVSLISISFAQVKAQAVHTEWSSSFCDWVECANNGQGELICGTVYQDAVYRFNKDGSVSGMHFGYDKSTFVGNSSGEVFILHGVGNLKTNKLDVNTIEFNQTLILFGNKGTKIVIKTKWQASLGKPTEMELYFEKCID